MLQETVEILRIMIRMYYIKSLLILPSVCHPKIYVEHDGHYIWHKFTESCAADATKHQSLGLIMNYKDETTCTIITSLSSLKVNQETRLGDACVRTLPMCPTVKYYQS